MKVQVLCDGMRSWKEKRRLSTSAMLLPPPKPGIRAGKVTSRHPVGAMADLQSQQVLTELLDEARNEMARVGSRRIGLDSSSYDRNR